LQKNALIIEAETDMRMNGSIYRLKNISFLCLLAVVLMGSCSYKNRNALFKQTDEINRDSIETVYVSNPTADYKEYRIQPFDEISIRNLQNPGLVGGESLGGSLEAGQATFLIKKDGLVDLPVIGSVKIGGLTKEEAKLKLQALYAEKLFINPIIELTISSLNVTLFGEAVRPGVYPLITENTGLTDVLAKAGGLTANANPKMVRIIRGDRNNPEVIYVNLKNVNTLASPKLILQNGDIIVVEKYRFYNSLDKVNTLTSIVSVFAIILNTYLILQRL
jgi:polysaccharide export outer membrane protein